MAESEPEQISLFLETKDLVLDNSKKSRTFGVFYEVDPSSKATKLLEKTELIDNSLSHQYIKSATTRFHFETVQQIIIRIYQSGNAEDVSDLTNHHLIGEADFTLGNIMFAACQRLELSLIHPGKSSSLGTVVVRAETLIDTRVTFSGHFSARDMIARDFFSKPDSFLTISRVNEDGSWTVVWKSAKINCSSNPKYGDVHISLTALANGDEYRPLRFTVWECNEDGKSHIERGYAQTSYCDLVNNAAPGATSTLPANSEPISGYLLPVLEPSKIDKVPGYINSGFLIAEGCQDYQEPSFLQYIKGGCEISLVVSIDLTSSNGSPEEPGTKHYIHPDPKVLNDYEKAILAVGKVLEAYDSDKKYPVYCYGGVKQRPDGTWKRDKYLFNMHPEEKEVEGVAGILQLYRQRIKNLKFAGPTNLAQSILTGAQIATKANCSQENQKYTILLILTDGMIDDMRETVSAIIDASRLPLSVIIVGIGSDSSEFNDMRILDGDDKMLQHQSLVCERDIVQFVPFSECCSKSQDHLAEVVLSEIPDQILSYMQMKGFTPNVRK